MHQVYTKMRNQSISSFCLLVRQHPHFNYRLNIIQTIFERIASQDTAIRSEVTETLFYLLKHTDQTLLDFKIDILKELNITLKKRPHKNM